LLLFWQWLQVIPIAIRLYQARCHQMTERARLFDELPAKVVRRLLEQLSSSEPQATALLFGYKPGTAGRLMTTEYVSFKEDLRVDEAIARIRTLARSMETVYYIYISDCERHLTGTLSFKDLVTAQLDQKLGEIMRRDCEYSAVQIPDFFKKSGI
jgi:magnesium transporter